MERKKREAPLTARLKKTTVEGIARPPTGSRSVLWDTEVKGFGVRVSSAGRRSYILRYRVGGRDTAPRTVTIGQHGSPWTTDQARQRALELLGQVRSGVDPAADRAKARNTAVTEEKARETRMFEVIADRWFKSHVQRGKLKSETDIDGVLRRDLKPAFVDKSIDEITRNDVATAIDTIGDRSPDAANKAFKWLRQMFNWMVEKGTIKASPLDGMKMPFPENKRSRSLSLVQILVVWMALDELPDPFRTFYRLLILLGQRLREISNLSWEELNLDASDWLIPGARTKNGIEHMVPLPEQAMDLIEALQPNKELRTGPVITTDGKVGISGFSKLKERLDAAVGKLITTSDLARRLVGGHLPSWVVHDLRRSLATGCQASGIPLVVTEAVLNHVSGSRAGLVRVYHLYEYYDEKAEALQRWADLVDLGLAAWKSGDLPAIIALDPSRRTRRMRRRTTTEI